MSETRTFTVIPAVPGWYVTLVVNGPPYWLNDALINCYDITANEKLFHAPDGKYYANGDFDSCFKSDFDSAEEVLKYYAERCEKVA